MAASWLIVSVIARRKALVWHILFKFDALHHVLDITNEYCQASSLYALLRRATPNQDGINP